MVFFLTFLFTENTISPSPFSTLFSKNEKHSELWFQTGLITSTKDYRRYIPIHELCKSLSSVVCEILPAAYALTGCDTTSSFFGIGKKSMLKAL
jgi:L-rhamnose isomerase